MTRLLKTRRAVQGSMATHRDPVCGMTVEEGKEAARETHGGRTYYFCSTHCAKKFRDNPGHFANEAPGKSAHATEQRENDYTPLVVVIGLIVLVTAALAYGDFRDGEMSLERTLSYFMAGFFLVFAGFKLIDLKGFAEAYSTYDLLAKRLPAYGFVYPFIELACGIGMILIPESRSLLIAELAVMAFSGLGVAIKLAKHEKFQCACLGTFLKVPLTKVTLVEDFGMAALALAMLLIS
jgi:YHS domain-containing protein